VSPRQQRFPEDRLFGLGVLHPLLTGIALAAVICMAIFALLN
jgi:hypothetical protein